MHQIDLGAIIHLIKAILRKFNECVETALDQYPPYATKTCIENLFKCLSVDHVIEIFVTLILEKQLLLVSRHKSLLT